MAAALAAAVGGSGVMSQVFLAGVAANEATVPNYTTAEAGNPFVAGWYADPDTAFFEGEYWVYPTASLAYEEQTYLDAFSSPDLVHWTKHARVLTTANIPWATKALWAPAPVARNGKYYLYFGANDIQEDEAAAGAVGGIGVAVADAPGGPFVDALGRPLVGDYHHGAQPIDQAVFVDDDGQAYLYYGGHSHANVAKLNADMTSLGRLDDDDDDHGNATAQFRSITPTDYVEGAQMLKRNGVYYFMWSEGGWQGPDYRVAYATASSPLGPFARRGTILAQDAAVARGSGHHGVVTVPGTDVHYIVYHRRPLHETDGNHRVLAYDRLCFVQDDANGVDAIVPVRMRVHDNFADGDMVGWVTRGAGGSWHVDGVDEDAALVFEPAGHSGDIKAGGRALLDTNFTDVVADARVALLPTDDDDDEEEGNAGIVFRATYDETDAGGSSYYAALLPRRGLVFLEKKYTTKTTTADGPDGVAGQKQQQQKQQQKRLGEATFATAGAAGSYHHLRVTAVGGDLKIFVDDMTSPVLALTDSHPLGAGANGVKAVGTTARFGNIAVSRPGDEASNGLC